ARLWAFKRLRMARMSGHQAAAQVIAAFESSYDAIKKDVVASTWWLRGEGTPSTHAKTWIENGFVLAAAGDRPAKLDQAFALAYGRALKQDRAKSVQLYLQVIDSS